MSPSPADRRERPSLCAAVRELGPRSRVSKPSQPSTQRAVDLLDSFFSDREDLSRTALRAAAQRLESLTGPHGRNFCFQEVDGGGRRIGGGLALTGVRSLALRTRSLDPEIALPYGVMLSLVSDHVPVSIPRLRGALATLHAKSHP